MVLSSAVTLSEYLPCFGSVFFSCKATVENACGLAPLHQGEFVILPVAFMFEGFEIAARVGDQSALLSEIADGGLKFRDGRVERSFGGGYIGLHAADVGLHRSHFSGNSVDVFFFFFGLSGNAGGCGLLLTLQLGRPRCQFFLGHAQVDGRASPNQLRRTACVW